MTRDETINFLSSLFLGKMAESGMSAPLTGISLGQVARGLAETAVNELGETLRLDPQIASVDAVATRPRLHRGRGYLGGAQESSPLTNTGNNNRA